MAFSSLPCIRARGRRVPRCLLPPLARTAICLAGLLAALPTPSRAQGLGPTVAGAAGGFAAGGLVGVGLLTARAQAGHYAYNVGDALRWGLPPLVAGTLGGAVLGSTDAGVLGRAGIGALAGTVGGAGVGWLLARGGDSTSEDRWSGAVLGGVAGLLVGAAVGALVDDDDDRGAVPEAAVLRVTVPVGAGGGDR